MKIKIIYSLACSLLLASTNFVYANQTTEQWTPQSRELLESLKNDVIETLSLIAEEESKRGHTLDGFQYNLELAEAYKVNLGLILEINSQQSALDVVSVTPGGLASSHGLTVEDEILSVDDIRVSENNELEILERLKRLKAGDQLVLKVSNENVTRKVVIPVTGRFIPRIKLDIGADEALRTIPTSIAYENITACGEVSVLLAPPSNSELYPVSFHDIDKSSNLANQTNIKFSVRKHTIYVHAHIESDVSNQQKETNPISRAIQINVRADTNYHLAARLNMENDMESSSGDDWEAVIWKTSKQECQP